MVVGSDLTDSLTESMECTVMCVDDYLFALERPPVSG